MGLIICKVNLLFSRSGKSNFAASLAAAGWLVVSSDAHRAVKGSFDAAIGTAAKPRALVVRGMVVDRCSVAPAERRRLLDLMHCPPPGDITAVFFNKSASDCAAQVLTRKGHPTLSGDRGMASCTSVVRGFLNRLVPPETSEGFGAVDVVTSHEESDALLAALGVAPLPLLPGACTVRKFPRTPHLLDAGGGAVTRDDLVMSADDAAAWLGGATVVVEEKVDGANLGVSLAADYSPLFQNRSHFVGSESATQFKGLGRWWAAHSRVLTCVLEPERHVLFGEWLAYQHSIHYTKLPALFVAFDIFDAVEGRFLSRAALRELLEPTGIPIVRALAEQVFASPRALLPLLDTVSGYGARRAPTDAEANAPVEGIYLRVDDGPWLDRRCKIVRPDFVQGIEQHWSTKKPVKNQVMN
jgi:atypical dual specificity phosphatase